MHSTISMTRAARCVTPNRDVPPGLTDEKRKEAVRGITLPGDANPPRPLPPYPLFLMAPRAPPSRLPSSWPKAASSRAVRLHQAPVCTCVEYRSSGTTSSFVLSPLGATAMRQNRLCEGAFISLFVFGRIYCTKLMYLWSLEVVGWGGTPEDKDWDVYFDFILYLVIKYSLNISDKKKLDENNK